MKICARCKQERSNGHKSYCLECCRIYQKEWYEKNTDTRRKQLDSYNRKMTERNATRVFQYLQTHPCVDCGEADPVVLEFDHRGDKIRTVSSLVHKSSWERVASEIQKCDVRCANCHRRKTAKERGWFRSLQKPSRARLVVRSAHNG